MQKLHNISFPLYKLRSYLNIEHKLLGAVLITTIKGEYIVDDTSLPGELEARRALLLTEHPNRKIYKLKERVLYLRQLVKYKSGTTFIDADGKIFKYQKSGKLNTVVSKKITRIKKITETRIVIFVEGYECPFLIYENLSSKAKYVSIMYTDSGPFMYDITSKRHRDYKRKI